MISTQPRPARRGFSLIEVAIALVIFVIGALAIIRIFPGALKVIGNNGNQQIATNLNRDVTARLKTDDAVPDATFNIAVNNDGTLQWTTSANTNHTADYTNPSKTDPKEKGDIPASVIGVPRFNATLPTTEEINTQTNNSALSRFRGIIGEQAKVYTVTVGGINVSYALTQFPVSLAKINGGTVDNLLIPTISQEYIVQNARINRQKQITFADATIDVNGQQLRLDDPANVGTRNVLPVGSMLYVSYRYYDTNSRVWGVREEAVPVPTALTLNTGSVTVSPPTPPTTTRGAISNYDSTNPTTGTVSEVIDVRVKRYAGVGNFGTGTIEEQTTLARCGLVQLPAGITTDTVSVDYVADWSWLMQKGDLTLAPDEERPAVTDYSYRQITLGVPLIEDQAPIGVYSFLRDPKAVDPSKAFYLSRFGTANPTPDPTTGNSGLVTPTASELRAGKLTFLIKNPPPPAPVNREADARVAYRTRDSWVQQLSVAASAYKPYALISTVAAATPIEPWRDYFLGNDNYLYFHAGEAGKTISISYITRESDGTVIRDIPIVNRPFVIDTQIIDTPASVPAGFATSGSVSRVKLTNSNGVDLPGNPNLPVNTSDAPNLLSLQGVRGTSFTVRTAYINGDKYAQTLLTSNRGTN